MASIRKLPTGKWQAQFRPVPGGKQITRTTTRKIDAQLWLNEQTAALVTGTYADPHAGKETFRSYFDIWSARQIWTNGTQQLMQYAIESTTFLDMPLRAITRAHVEEWVKAMQLRDRTDGSKGLAPRTIHNRFRNARSVFRAAIAERKIGMDPTAGVRLPQLRKAEFAMSIPTPEQVGELLGAIEAEHVAAMALGAFGGLRLGEIIGLQVRDIDFLKRDIHVRRQVQRVAGNPMEVRAPKYGSERHVAAADGLLALLARHIAFHGLEAGSSDWMFPGRFAGEPEHGVTVRKRWMRAQRATGHDTFTLHDLRHFYASGLIAANCDVSTVQHALGHASPAMTLGTYTHLWPKSEDRTRAAAQAMTIAALGGPDEYLTRAEPGSA